MIEHFDIEKAGGFFDLLSKFFIGPAWPETTGGVVMAENDTNGFFFQGFFQDDAGVGNGAGDSSLADYFKMIDTIGPIQEQHRKNFVGKIAESGL